MSAIQVEVTHTLDGPMTALIQELVESVKCGGASKKKATRRKAPAKPEADEKPEDTTAAPLTSADRLAAVRPRIRAHVKEHGKPATKALFDGLSGESLPTLKTDDDWDTLIERLDAAS